MKPLPWILPAVLAAPAVVPLVSAFAEDGGVNSITDDFLQSLTPGAELTPGGQRSRVAAAAGESVATPSPATEPHLQASLGTSSSLHQQQSYTLRLPQPPAGGEGLVRFGDTLSKLADRYGLSLQDLLELNPGLESSALVVGSAVRVSRSAPLRPPSNLVALRPLGSGGVSWPEMPRYDGPSQPDGQQPGRFRETFPSTSWVWPTQGVFTSGYGWRWGRMHKGIDVANNVGTPIVAAQRGRVSFAGWDDSGYGYLVEISHEDGSTSLYGHNSRILVREGDLVEQGQVISQMGSTGRSTGPHLHFEIHPPGRGAANPLEFLPPRA